MVDERSDPQFFTVDNDVDSGRPIVDLAWLEKIEESVFYSPPVAAPCSSERWRNVAIVLLQPMTAFVAWLGVFRSRCYGGSFLIWVQIVFLASVVGLGACLWPESMPGLVSFWQATSVHRTHVILGNSVSVIVPLLLLYAGYGSWASPETGRQYVARRALILRRCD